MFAGHVGAALALGRAERRVNVGLLVFAALLLDLLLWLFVLLGIESVVIPQAFARDHQAAFVFPYSHGLVASLLWSGAAAAIGYVGYARSPDIRRRAALLIAVAVFSHWLLDALVHRPELAVAGPHSYRFGLGLWDQMPLALGVEAAIVAAGLLLFMPGNLLPRTRAIALTLASLLVLAFTVVGMTLAPPPPSASAMAASSLSAVVVVCGLSYWMGQRTTRRTAYS